MDFSSNITLTITSASTYFEFQLHPIEFLTRLSPNTEYFYNGHKPAMQMSPEEIEIALSVLNPNTTIAEIQELLDDGRIDAIRSAAANTLGSVSQGCNASVLDHCIDDAMLRTALTNDPIQGFNTVEYDKATDTFIERVYHCSDGKIELAIEEALYLTSP